MLEIKQYEVWMINLGEDNIVGHEQKGNRPFFVISDSYYNKASGTPIGFLMSTSEHKKANRFSIETVGNLKGSVNVSQIRTLSADRFLYRMGVGTEAELKIMMETFQKQIINK